MSKKIRKAYFRWQVWERAFSPRLSPCRRRCCRSSTNPIQYAWRKPRRRDREFILVTGRGKARWKITSITPSNWATLMDRGKTDALETLASTLYESGQISYVRQQQPLGLGHAVWCARNLVGDEPFAVLLPDDLVLAEQGCLAQMVEVYHQVGGNVVAVMDVPREQTNRYGILDVVQDDGRVAKAKGLVEKPDPAEAPSTLSIIGRYILDPQVLRALDRKEKGAGGEIQLTDAMARTIDEVPFHGLRFAGTRFDCGSKEGFLEANVAYALARDDLRGAMQAILGKYA